MRCSRQLKEGLNFLVRPAYLCILAEMKICLRVIFVVATGVAIVVAVLLWRHGEPRRDALQEVSKLADTLANNHGSELLEIVVTPAAVSSKTQAEQEEFIAKALADEISPEGVLALKNHAQFGLVKSIFPDEYAKWCLQAGVTADDCVAFKMEHDGIQAAVLLVHEGQTYRVVRCNNVKQMAMNLNHG